MNKEYLFFTEQIYYKFSKNKKQFKKMVVNSYIKEISDKINSLSKNAKCLLIYIQLNLTKKNGSYVDNQKIKLSYLDKDLVESTTTNKTCFYSMIKELEDLNIIIKYKSSIYFANPYFLDNMSQEQWDEFKRKINNDWADQQGSNQLTRTLPNDKLIYGNYKIVNGNYIFTEVSQPHE